VRTPAPSATPLQGPHRCLNSSRRPIYSFIVVNTHLSSATAAEQGTCHTQRRLLPTERIAHRWKMLPLQSGCQQENTSSSAFTSAVLPAVRVPSAAGQGPEVPNLRCHLPPKTCQHQAPCNTTAQQQVISTGAGNGTARKYVMAVAGAAAASRNGVMWHGSKSIPAGKHCAHNTWLCHSQ
jgi:hypothetical protein